MRLAFCPDFPAHSLLCRLVVLHFAKFKLAAYHHPLMYDACLNTPALESQVSSIYITYPGGLYRLGVIIPLLNLFVFDSACAVLEFKKANSVACGLDASGIRSPT